jgi:hypothetical protein
MPHALQVINAFKTALTGGAFEALAPGTGDSFQIQNVPQDAPAFLAEIWGVNNAHACELSIYGSRWHDQTFGIRAEIPSGAALAPVNRSTNVSPCGSDQRVYPSDTLTVQVNGTAGDDVNATFLVYYTDLPGISARLASWASLRPLIKNLVGIHVTVTPGDGDWGASVALNSSDDRLHADTDYAVLGFTAPTPIAALAISGIDTGNMRVGGPVLGDAQHDANLFLDLANYYQAPLIPVINANNKGAIFLQGASTDAAATAVDVMLAELTTKFAG